MSKTWFYRLSSSITLGLILPIIGSMICYSIFKDEKFIQVPFHSSLETIGAVISLLVVLVLIQIKKQWNNYNSQLAWVMCSLISMGVLDLAHAFVHVSNNFAWFHSVATFTGGMFFACIWIPIKTNTKLPLYVFILNVIFASIFLAFPHLTPDLISGDKFRFISRFFNLSGGVCFLIGSVYFLKQFSYDKAGYNYLLSCHGLLFGVAGLTFEFANLWDTLWWWWHFLRLLGYIAGFIYFYQVLKQIGGELNKSRREAINSNLAKSKFLSTISHELRTPMNTIIGISDILLETPLNSSQKSKMNVLQKSGENLLTIINNVLDVSRIESGEYNLEYSTFNLNNFLNEIKIILSKKAQEQNVELFVETKEEFNDLYINSDQFKLRQILINLINNGLKFTNNGIVSLHLTVEIISENQVIILFEVIDTGIGISKKNLNTIFERFHQIDSGFSRNFSGSGLGLSIAQEFALLLGSEISVKSEINKGSNFSFNAIFDIGKKVIESQPETEKIKFNGFLNDTHILLVDDVIENRLLIKIYLSEFKNIKIVECSDGVEAIEAFTTQLFDIVIMDIQMPRMNGLEAIKVMRYKESLISPKNKTIYIALSAHAFNEDKIISINAGFDFHLEKPIRKKQFINFIEQLNFTHSTT